MSLLSALLNPRTLAVVGASRDPQKVGSKIFQRLSENPALQVFPINPHAEAIGGRQAYPSLRQLPEPLDVVVIATPLATVETIVDDCIGVKAKVVVILTAGFAENGEEGKLVQERIAAKLFRANIGLLGPNCMGFLYTPNRINASFGPHEVQEGNIAVISQSGAMLSAMFQQYASSNVGVSLAISLGNRAGVSENDCLEFLIDDVHTKVVVLYLESFANLPRFFQLVSRLARTKAVFVLKGGVSDAGLKASLSHTAALATPQALLIDASKQAGFVMMETFEQMVRASTAASIAATLPENVAIVTNAGGPSVVMVDELASAKVPLAVLSDATVRALEEQNPGKHIANPLDVLGDATGEDFARALGVLYADPGIDAIACIITQQSVTDVEKIVVVLEQPHGKKLLFVSLVGGDQLEPYRQRLRKAHVFATTYPNEIVETLVALARARENMRNTSAFSLEARTPTQPYPADYAAVVALLEKYAIQTPKFRIIERQDQLASLKDLAFPLVAKTTDLALKHKANVGAVVVRIADVAAATRAFEQIATWNFPTVFQETVVDGVEALVGAKRDAQFGWYMAVGLGGSYTNVLSDRAHCFLPATRRVMEKTLDRTKLSALLTPPQRALLLDFMERFARLLFETQRLEEFECNPVFITKDACVVADVKRA